MERSNYSVPSRLYLDPYHVADGNLWSENFLMGRYQRGGMTSLAGRSSLLKMEAEKFGKEDMQSRVRVSACAACDCRPSPALARPSPALARRAPSAALRLLLLLTRWDRARTHIYARLVCCAAGAEQVLGAGGWPFHPSPEAGVRARQGPRSLRHLQAHRLGRRKHGVCRRHGRALQDHSDMVDALAITADLLTVSRRRHELGRHGSSCACPSQLRLASARMQRHDAAGAATAVE